MSLLDDVLKALDRWQEWKRMREAPGRIDELEKRMAALEKVPPEKSGDTCPYCGKPAFRLFKQEERRLGRLLAGFTETWKCGECGQTKQIAKNV